MMRINFDTRVVEEEAYFYEFGRRREYGRMPLVEYGTRYDGDKMRYFK